MTAKQARQLLPGTIVMQANNPNDLGTVRAVGPGGIFVDWENGPRGWIAFENAKAISVR